MQKDGAALRVQTLAEDELLEHRGTRHAAPEIQEARGSAGRDHDATQLAVNEDVLPRQRERLVVDAGANEQRVAVGGGIERGLNRRVVGGNDEHGGAGGAGAREQQRGGKNESESAHVSGLQIRGKYPPAPGRGPRQILGRGLDCSTAQ